MRYHAAAPTLTNPVAPRTLVALAGLTVVTTISTLTGCGSGTTSNQGIAWNSNANTHTSTSSPSASTSSTNAVGFEMHTSAAAGVPSRDLAERPMTADVLPATTLNIRQATFAEEGADFDPAVSSDGAFLVYASTQHRPTSDIYIKRTDSRVVTQLTSDAADDAMPAISPDGSKIAFASNRGGSWDIYVMPISGGQAVQVTDDAGDDVHPSWSPDGTALVFSRLSASSGRWEMWVAEASNASVSHFIGFGLLPKWCPAPGTGANASDKILYQLGRERGRRSFGVWTIDYADGMASNPTEIASSADKALINPTWSPDGQWVVFAEAQASTTPGRSIGAAAGESSLWMVGVDGDGRVRLTQGDGSHLSPTWGAQGRLYFVSNRTGRDTIWSLDLAPSVRAAQLLTNDSTMRTARQAPAQPEMRNEASAEPASTDAMATVSEEPESAADPR
jgi:dipeptidyl aminopeptidase/acylaminoacyl peptidase